MHVFHFREGLLRYKYLCAEGTPTSDAVVGKVCRGGVDKRQIWELRWDFYLFLVFVCGNVSFLSD